MKDGDIGTAGGYIFGSGVDADNSVSVAQARHGSGAARQGTSAQIAVRHATFNADGFNRYLRETDMVLDMSSGSGNFLVVSYQLVRELQAEVIEALYDLGAVTRAYDPSRPALTPDQFRGIEVNIHTVVISELVLQIANLQDHCRTYGWVTPGQPVLTDKRSIEHGDAIIEHDGIVDGVCINPRRPKRQRKVLFIGSKPDKPAPSKKSFDVTVEGLDLKIGVGDGT